MVAGLWVDLMLVLSLITGTAAVTLCLLTWEILREASVGRAVGALTVVMALFILYHGIALSVPDFELLASLFKSITFTGVALFVAVLIRFERGVVESTSTGGET